MVEQLLSGAASPSELENADEVQMLHEKLQATRNKLTEYKTAQIWLQYLDMLDILCRFLRAERLGLWTLHLQGLYDMLPYLAASGHNLYVKSIQIYLQKMFCLKENLPAVHEHFMNGLHVVRRSDRHWAGISTDLAIEQCLMRSLKTRGGLTRGRGLTEVQRLTWVLSSPACATVNNAMQSLTGVAFTTSEQHKETTTARISKDLQDVNDMMKYLIHRNPFSTDSPSLRNIATGEAADNSVNCYNARSVGQQILASMQSKKVAEYTYKRKAQAVTMSSKASVKIKDDVICVDPILLFQRLVCAGMNQDDFPNMFSHELSSYPTALFEAKSLMRPANKSSLAHSLWTKMQRPSSCPSNVQFILDGGALIHKLPWTKGETWEEIMLMYCNYVGKKYGQAIVVFDGYIDSPSTKDQAHTRRNNGCVGVEVHFEENMKLHMKKDDFLCNPKNKQRFIQMLSQKLETSGCEVHQSTGDADLLIVKTALASAQERETIVIASDTDILVLLIHHTDITKHDVWLQSEAKKESSKCWNIAATKNHLGASVCSAILFAHAFLGCDTTSRIYGIGKNKAIEKLSNHDKFRVAAQAFLKPSASPDNIIQAGNDALVILYNGKEDDTLDKLRYVKFCEKSVSKTAAIEPHALPPTSGALKYHSLRVYQQVQVWNGLEDSVPPEQWGWKVISGKMLPLMTDQPAAPEKLLEMVWCNCKTGCTTYYAVHLPKDWIGVHFSMWILSWGMLKFFSK